jgi:hypothetical integral membrane protein (TIGR02206 family)
VGIASPAWVVTLAVTAIGAIGLPIAARRHPGPWVEWTTKVLAIALVAVSVAWIVSTSAGHWKAATGLPVALCDIATLVAAAALWWQASLLIELTWFWGLAGSLQSLLTPDVKVGFPSVEFLEYVIAHAGIVTAATLLVIGLRRPPRPGAVPRVFIITALYTALVGAIDAATGGNYMYLSHRPNATTLLNALGPWPWYVFSATGVALVLLIALDAPFWAQRRRARTQTMETAASVTAVGSGNGSPSSAVSTSHDLSKKSAASSPRNKATSSANSG